MLLGPCHLDGERMVIGEVGDHTKIYLQMDRMDLTLLMLVAKCFHTRCSGRGFSGSGGRGKKYRAKGPGDSSFFSTV